LAAVLGGVLALLLSQTPLAPYATLTAAIVAAATASLTPWARSAAKEATS